jgi:hypothetical protein
LYIGLCANLIQHTEHKEAVAIPNDVPEGKALAAAVQDPMIKSATPFLRMSSFSAF